MGLQAEEAARAYDAAARAIRGPGARCNFPLDATGNMAAPVPLTPPNAAALAAGVASAAAPTHKASASPAHPCR